MDKYKICKHCEEKKSLNSFPKHQFPRMGHRDKCNACCGFRVQMVRSKKWVVDTISKLELTGTDY